jgi:hypothetical protein
LKSSTVTYQNGGGEQDIRSEKWLFNCIQVFALENFLEDLLRPLSILRRDRGMPSVKEVKFNGNSIAFSSGGKLVIGLPHCLVNRHSRYEIYSVCSAYHKRVQPPIISISSKPQDSTNIIFFHLKPHKNNNSTSCRGTYPPKLFA